MLPLSFDPIALERCFLVADVLAEEFQTPFLEYALVGLSESRRPLHVVRTPLLPGQRVSPASVEQSGSAVLRLRREIQGLSLRAGRSLLPAVFVHRHPSRSCTPSATDQAFLRGVFVDQVSTVLSVPGLPSGVPMRCPRGCTEPRPNGPSADGMLEEPGVAFSLIVSRQRNYELHAVAKQRCAVCGNSWVCDVPAKLDADLDGRLSSRQLADLRESLKQEIEEKFDPRDLEEKYYEPRA
jgi:hypothetical protein